MHVLGHVVDLLYSVILPYSMMDYDINFAFYTCLWPACDIAGLGGQN